MSEIPWNLSSPHFVLSKSRLQYVHSDPLRDKKKKKQESHHDRVLLARSIPRDHWIPIKIHQVVHSGQEGNSDNESVEEINGLMRFLVEGNRRDVWKGLPRRELHKFVWVQSLAAAKNNSRLSIRCNYRRADPRTVPSVRLQLSNRNVQSSSGDWRPNLPIIFWFELHALIGSFSTRILARQLEKQK